MYPLIDLHCDTMYALEHSYSNGTLAENTGHVDLRWMEKAGRVTTCFALFVSMEEQSSAWEAAKRLHARFEQELSQAEGRIRQVSTKEQIEANPVQGAILTCEEAQILEGKLDRIAVLADWHVRMSTLTWNFENDLAVPHHRKGGLKPFGYAAVEAMEHANILVDVSHLNDEGFWDLSKIAKKPLVASHSNCRAVTNISRNLSDSMIRRIADSSGVVGLNFCPSFLSDDWMHASLEAMVLHAKHLRNKGGASVLAIGSDYDGISGELSIPHYDAFPLLWEALEKVGFRERELEGMWYHNAARLFS